MATSIARRDVAAERWFWPLWLGAFGLAVLLTLAARARPHFPGDVHAALALQALEWPGEDAIVRAENVLGSGLVPAVIMLLATLAFLVARRFVACLAFLISSAMWSLNTVLKDLAQRPRPTASLIEVNEHATGYSFPSGHALGSLVFFGTLAALVAARIRSTAARALVWIVAILLVAAIGFSRIYLGVHYPTDVIGGYAAALVWVIAVALGDHARQRHVERYKER